MLSTITEYRLLFLRVDSIMLLEEGFTVTSVDASDKMLKQAHKTRWNRRKEENFDEWGNRVNLLQQRSKHNLMFDCVN